MATLWWTTPDGTRRLLVEHKAMADHFPHFELRHMTDSLGWVGKLTTLRGNRYEVLVKYPPNFPNEPALVFPTDPILEVLDEGGRRLVHQWSDGHLCLYHPDDKTFPSIATAATVTAVAAAWLHAYEEWLASGRKHWPGPAAD
jgi:hypothetical protein